jgi:hypothetical protein
MERGNLTGRLERAVSGLYGSMGEHRCGVVETAQLEGIIRELLARELPIDLPVGLRGLPDTVHAPQVRVLHSVGDILDALVGWPRDMIISSSSSDRPGVRIVIDEDNHGRTMVYFV